MSDACLNGYYCREPELKEPTICCASCENSNKCTSKCDDSECVQHTWGKVAIDKGVITIE